jgi:hypothetical protein
MATTRLGLRKKGDIVLVGGKYKWDAFIIDEVTNDNVIGKWLTTNKEESIEKGLPTKNTTKKWFKQQESKTQDEINEKLTLLNRIRSIYIKL